MIKEENYQELVEELKDLRQDILSVRFDENRSDMLNELNTALALAQSEFETAYNEASNPFFKSRYAKLVHIVKASRPYLTKHGLSVRHEEEYNDGKRFLRTILAHSSGQWTSSLALIEPLKPDIQSYGSYLAYLKRYHYTMITGVTTSDDMDDDGESLMERKDPYISLVHINQLKKLLAQLPPHVEKTVLEGFGISSLAEIKMSAFTGTHKRLKQMIGEENEAD